MENLEYELDDPRLLTLDELMTDTSIFPPINNNSFGKATGTLIKALLNNLDGTPSKGAYGF